MTTDENVKPIIIRDNETDEEYTLEFNKESVIFAERHGFDINELTRFPMTKIPEFFYYAFRMHHKALSRGQTDKILEKLGKLPEGFVERLANLYTVPFEYMVDDDEENERKNSEMTVIL